MLASGPMGFAAGDEDAPFDRIDPAPADETPLLVEIPHAGVRVPSAIRPSILTAPHTMERDADRFVDELFADAPLEGATFLAGRCSRYVVDLNRAEEDVDADAVEGAAPGGRAPRGVIWRVSGDGGKILARPLTQAELAWRLDAFHRPYHREIQQIVAQKLQRFGLAVVLAAHSMPSRARLASGELGPPRADVVPGTRGRTSADPRFIDCVDRHAQAAGMSVRHDDPYRGGFTTQHYGRPHARVHVVQVELARRLYMDEEAVVKHTRFPDVRAWCRGLVARLVETALR